MNQMRHARAMLGALREAAVLEDRVRRAAHKLRPMRPRPGEHELVEIAPGVWGDPRDRVPRSKLGELHQTFERWLDAAEELTR